jgi:hypothetical protein
MTSCFEKKLNLQIPEFTKWGAGFLAKVAAAV